MDALFALPLAYSQGRQEAPPSSNQLWILSSSPGCSARGTWDDGVEGDHGVEGLGREAQIGHICFEEPGHSDVPPGQLQLPRGEVYARDREALGEPACYGHARAAAKVEHGRSRRRLTRQLL
jgi:hypothetical protein